MKKGNMEKEFDMELYNVELPAYHVHYLHYLREIAQEVRIQTGYAELSYYVVESAKRNFVFIASMDAYRLGSASASLLFTETGLYIETAGDNIPVEVDDVEAATNTILDYIDAENARRDKMEAFEEGCEV